MCASILNLPDRNVNVSRIKIVLDLILDQVLIQQFGIVELIAGLDPE